MATRFQQPSELYQLAPGAGGAQPGVVNVDITKKEMSSGYALNLLIWFIVIAAIIWLVLYLFRFPFVQKRDITGNLTGEVDQARAVVYAVIIAAVITLIIYLARPSK